MGALALKVEQCFAHALAASHDEMAKVYRIAHIFADGTVIMTAATFSKIAQAIATAKNEIHIVRAPYRTAQ